VFGPQAHASAAYRVSSTGQAAVPSSLEYPREEKYQKLSTCPHYLLVYLFYSFHYMSPLAINH
jgi:hypothetical protein